jgi:hypothetical protein
VCLIEQDVQHQVAGVKHIVITEYLFHPLIFVLLRYYLMYVKLQFRKIYKSKATEKVSGFPHMVCLSFLLKKSEKFKLKIDAISV